MKASTIFILSAVSLAACLPGPPEDGQLRLATDEPEAPANPPSDPEGTLPMTPVPMDPGVDLVPDLATGRRTSQLQRLPNRVLVHALRDWFGAWGLTPPDISEGLTAPEKVRGWENNGYALTLDPRLFEAWFSAMESNAPDLVDIFESDCVDAGSIDCTKSILARAGRLAHRRTLTAAELEAFAGRVSSAGEDLRLERAAALTALLVSPPVLYRIELGEEGRSRPATSLEIASRLAALIWASVPDAALLDAAESGDLTDAEERRRAVARMVEDPRARDGMDWFFEQWLELPAIFRAEKNPEVYPAWQDDFPVAMYREMNALIDHLVWSGEAGRYQDLFQTDLVLPTGGLDALYGVSAGEVLVPAPNRQGLLTRGGFLAREGFEQTSPVLRGYWLREHLLCDLVPEAPANVDNVPPPIEPGANTRERIAARTSGSCAGCHVLMNDIGFAFEGFDADGQAREEDNGRPVDTSGQAVASDLRSFGGAAEMQDRLTSSRMGPTCFARQLFRYGLGRVEATADRPDLDRLMSVFDATDGDILAVFTAVSETEAFLTVEPAR